MPKKGEHYQSPRKVFSVPNDIAVLKNYAGVIINQMRNEYNKRINRMNKKGE